MRNAITSRDCGGPRTVTALARVYFAIFLGTLAISRCAEAQKILATVPTGSFCQAIAFNPATHKIYTLGEPENEVTEIDGETFKTTVIALGPTREKSLNGAIRVDPGRNRLYAVNVANSSLAVVDLVTRAVKFVPVGTHPTALEINAETNKIYVVNSDSNDITIVDGATLRARAIAVGSFPAGIAINAKTNRIYVTNSHSNDVSVIDGKNNEVRTIAVGPYPSAVAVNTARNRVYVGNLQADTVTVIHGQSRHTRTIKVGPYPFCIVLNERTNRIYLNHQAMDAISVIDGRTNAVKIIGSGIIARGAPDGLAVDELRNKIYVGEWTTKVTIIDGRTNTTSTVANPGYNTFKIVGNPIANEFYTVNVTTNINNDSPSSSVGIWAGSDVRANKAK